MCEKAAGLSITTGDDSATYSEIKPRRPIPAAAAATVKLDPAFLPEIECPICFGIPFPPIYQCSKGHHICHHCRKKVVKCPLCKGPYPVEGTRNFIAEALVMATDQECMFKSEGCAVVCRGDVLLNHHKVCPYRGSSCPMFGIDGCKLGQDSMKMSQIKQHMLSVHKGSYMQDAKSSLRKMLTMPQDFTIGFGDQQPSIAFNSPCIIDFDGNTVLVLIYRISSMTYFVPLWLRKAGDGIELDAEITIQPGKRRSQTWKHEVIPASAFGGVFAYGLHMTLQTEFRAGCIFTDLKYFGTLNPVTREYEIEMEFKFVVSNNVDGESN